MLHLKNSILKEERLIMMSNSLSQKVHQVIMEKKIIFLGIMIFFMILATDAFLIEPNIIDVNTINISDTGNNMTIVFVADFQRNNSDPSFVKRAVSLINEQNPDLILLGGDYIHWDVDEFPAIEPLKKLDAKYGTFGVLGNHDYDVYGLNRYGADTELAQQVTDFLESEGTIDIIQNDSVQIQNMSIAFLDSYWAGLRDDTLLDEPKQEFRIILTHNQNKLEINSDKGDLYLFGHTHCGQVRLPVVGSVPKIMGFEGEYDYRHNVVNDADVYTTCGLTPAPRFLNPPEITIIKLTDEIR